MYLRPKTNLSDQRPFRSIKVIDDIVTELVGGETMERFLFCMECLRGKEQKRFFSDIGALFKPRNELQLCESMIGGEIGEGHGLTDHQLSLMASQNPKAEDLKAFLKEGIKNIKKTTLKERTEELQRGDQIWIYRDGSTGCWNPVASMMPYAHVAVFIGDGMVVHVAKADLCRHACMMGTIKKEPIASVIKPGDQGNQKFALI